VGTVGPTSSFKNELRTNWKSSGVPFSDVGDQVTCLSGRLLHISAYPVLWGHLQVSFWIPKMYRSPWLELGRRGSNFKSPVNYYFVRILESLPNL
jgi:hypothetical protein